MADGGARCQRVVLLLPLLILLAHGSGPAPAAAAPAGRGDAPRSKSVYEAAMTDLERYRESHADARAAWADRLEENSAREHKKVLDQVKRQHLGGGGGGAPLAAEHEGSSLAPLVLPQQQEDVFASTAAAAAIASSSSSSSSSNSSSEGAEEEAGRRRLQSSTYGSYGNIFTLNSVLTNSHLGLAFPPLNTVVPHSAFNTTLYRFDSVTPPPSVDWRYTAAMTPVASQLQCESCWALAVADSISIMANLQRGLGSMPQTVGPYATTTTSNLGTPATTQYSPQQIMDCTDGAAANACQGGWPEWAFEYAEIVGSSGLSTAASYPYLAKSGVCRATLVADVTYLTAQLNIFAALNNLLGGFLSSFFGGLFGPSSSSTASQLSGWERTPIMSSAQLKKAVCQEPVVAFIAATSADFQLYKGGVYGFNGTANCTQDINHVVLVVGYGTDAVAGDYWIIKNTWGPDWGENGYARVAMKDGAGVCGITSAPALFPINLVATGSNPCNVFPPTCGGGTCYVRVGGSLFQPTTTARCNCPSGYAENVYKGLPTCVLADPCGQNPNPCGVGTCANTGDGSFSCTCIPGTVVGSTITGTPTCVAGQNTGVFTYTALAGDTCTTVGAAYSLPIAQLQRLNPALNCSYSLVAGQVLVVGSDKVTQGCSAIYVTKAPVVTAGFLGSSTTGDTFASIATQAGINLKDLLQLNPTLGSLASSAALPAGLQVCTAAFQAVKSPAQNAALPTSCGKSYTVVQGNGQDQCSYITAAYGLVPGELELLNPGLNCGGGALPPQLSLCVAPNSTQTLPTVTCTQWYSVKHGDHCPTIWQAANLTASQFFILNPGVQCDAHNLAIGQQVCIAGPQSSTFSTAIPYTVLQGDTLAVVASMFKARCGYYATPLSICTYSSLANCTSPLTPGAQLMIPCQWPVGRSCGCPSGGVAVCGADGQWYPNYCSAVCNFATPANAYTNGGCSDLRLACAGHACFGPPDWAETGFPSTCPWPTWWPVDYSYWGTDVCSFYRGACWNCCTGSVGTVNQGYPSASWYACYDNCKGHVNYGC